MGDVRGQALVETALVLPLLLILLLGAIDLGRVFFGWVALQNAARIGADFAAEHADAWNPDGDAQARATYQDLIAEDLAVTNCSRPYPEPSFDDIDAVPGIEFGDLATVQLSCEFQLVTPLASLFAGPIDMAASSTFAVHEAVVAGVPDAPPLPCGAPEASFETDPLATAAGGSRLDGTDPDGTGFKVDFDDTTNISSSCTGATWTWDFDDGGPPVLTRDVEDHPFIHTGGGHTDYRVTLTVDSGEGDSDRAELVIRVSAP